MSTTRRPMVAICGSSAPDELRDAAALELGRGIARRGWVVICGGRGGVMEAACRGAHDARQRGASGFAIGVLPEQDRSQANPYCEVSLATGLGFARNVVIVLSADVVLLVGGSTGTLSEAAYAWQYGKPMVALTSTGGWAAKLAGTTMDDRRDDAVLAAADVGQALELTEQELRRAGRL